MCVFSEVGLPQLNWTNLFFWNFCWSLAQKRARTRARLLEFCPVAFNRSFVVCPQVLYFLYYLLRIILGLLSALSMSMSRGMRRARFPWSHTDHLHQFALFASWWQWINFFDCLLELVHCFAMATEILFYLFLKYSNHPIYFMLPISSSLLSIFIFVFLPFWPPPASFFVSSILHSLPSRRQGKMEIKKV